MRALALTLVVAAALHAVAAESQAVVIDFNGGTEGSSVGTIGIATFSAAYAVQGNPRGAFGAAAGVDTGTSGSFAAIGNGFITSPDGDDTPSTIGGMRTKSITVDFATAVLGLSFDAVDTDYNAGVQS